MECHACGREVAPDDRFCNGCGSKLGADDTTTATDADGSTPEAGHGPNDPGRDDGLVTDTTTTDRSDDPTSTAPAVTAITPATRETTVDTADPGAPDTTTARTATAATADTVTATPTTTTSSTATRGTTADVTDPGAPDTTAAVPVGAAGGNDGGRTELIEITEGDDWDDEPDWARTGSVPVAAAPTGTPPDTDTLPETEPITEVWMESVADDTDTATTPYDAPVTGQVETHPAATAQMPTVTAPAPVAPPPGTRFGFGLITLVAIVTGIVSLGALFADVIVITSDVRIVPGPDAPPTFRTGTWIADDLADNLSIAGLIATVLMVAGGVAAGFRWRWGAGLAGGAGLGMAGLAALALGLAQFPVDVARRFAEIPSDDPFVLTITRDLGFWLFVVAGALGVVLFFASVNEAAGDRRAGLNPWIAALGALAVVVAVAGPLINENQALFSDNWYLVDAPGEPSALLLVGRLVQLSLFLIGGVVGFLTVRRWGLGVAVGATLPAVWLALSVLLDLTDDPVGPGFRNPGATDMHLHGVTIIGMSAVLAMLVLALIAAYDQSGREHR